MRQNRIMIICEVVIVSLMILTGCSSKMNSIDQDRSSGKIVGSINTIDGAPVRNATVKMTTADFSPDQKKNVDGILSTTTDGTGQYSFSVGKSGLYSINAEKNGLYSFQDSVYGSEKEQVEAGAGTLKAPGSISGIARLNRPDDNRSIIILVLGTTTYCQPSDTNGAFVINNLAEGVYHLKLLSSLRGYTVLDTNIQVFEGKNSNIGVPLQLVRTGLSGVGPVKAEFNKAMQFVTLTWPPIDTTDVQGLYVFRNTTVAGKPHMILKKTTTQFIDDIPDTSMTGDTLTYIVVAYGANDKIGTVGTPQKIRIDGALSLLKSIPNNIYSLFPNGQFTSLAVDNNLNFFICSDGKIFKIDSTGNVVARYTYNTDLYAYQPKLALDNNGNCYFLNDRNKSLIKFSNNLEIQKTYTYTIDPAIGINTSDNSFFYISNGERNQDTNKIWIFNSNLEMVDSMLFAIPDCSLLLHKIRSGRLIFEVWPNGGSQIADIPNSYYTDLKTVEILNLNHIVNQFDKLIEGKISQFCETSFPKRNDQTMVSPLYSFANGNLIFFDSSTAYVINKEKCIINRIKIKKCMPDYWSSIISTENGQLCYLGDKKEVRVYELR